MLHIRFTLTFFILRWYFLKFCRRIKVFELRDETKVNLRTPPHNFLDPPLERALKHTGELKELKKKMANAAKDSNMREEELEQVLDKLDLENTIMSETVRDRPRRKAALKAMELHQQMIADNAI